jgi:hypothetical protein
MTKAFNILIVLLLSLNSVFAQAPKKYDFVDPLKIPMILSGTFAELRTNHFHTGLDIKTKGTTGLPVIAIDNGYVSRISISPFGYGKALYIDHPNGYTSVYAHLDHFCDEIEKLVKKKQYEKKRYSITIYPKKNELKIIKGSVIAKTGNTGSSAGPHLHFEIRDTKTAKPQNPFNFGFNIKDHKKPTINDAYIYNFDKPSGKILSLNKIEHTSEKKDTIFSSAGWTALGIDAFDRLDYANNKNGTYSTKLKINDNLYFEFKMNSLDFSEQRYINSFIDYAYYKENKRRIQKLFLDPGNKLSLYDFKLNKGYFLIEKNKFYNIEIIVEDYKGNKTTNKYVIKGISPFYNIATDNNAIVLDYSQDNFFETKNFKIKIPKGSLYNNANFTFSKEDSIFFIGDRDIPLQKSCNISLKIENKIDSISDKMIIVMIGDRNNLIYAGGKIEGDFISTKTRNFGEYTISYDTIAPTIKPINFRNEKWLSKQSTLKVKISDNLSGIKSYKGYIDGEWIRMEYDAKNHLLTYKFSDRRLTGSNHTFELILKDNVDNITKYKAIFHRKQ